MSRKFFASILAALVLVVFSATSFAQVGQQSSPIKVRKASDFGQTQPLSSMRHANLPPVLRRAIGNRTLSKDEIKQLREKLVKDGKLRPATKGVVIPLDRKPPATSPLRRVKDPAVQSKAPRGPNVFTTPGVGFDGLGLSTGSSPGFTPPDTNMAVGQNYIVEAVNVEMAVYDKTDGSLVDGPFDIANLWTNMGGACLTAGTSDPIVNYDQAAHRWIISQMTTNASPMNFHCVAVSQTDDPTGAYYTYGFEITAGVPDYPKVAVWTNAYYATFNDFNPNFNGVIFVAYDSAAMQAGDPNAQMVMFEEASNAYSDLPVEYDGTPNQSPPAGAPALFVNYISPNLFGSSAPYAIEVWAMNVDWSNPASSTLTDAAQLTVDPFTDIVCGNARTCIPQASSGQKLDAISDRLMYRAVYRNFGGHQAIVLMHNVGADTSGNPPVGERWYELRAPSGSIDPTTWTVHQQGTYAPADGSSRWMGSIAFDHVGNIAMGYSLSGPSQDPEIVYTGRQAGDPAGQMTQPETVLQAAGGADTGSYGRWGDYTAMQIDPVDDCTFWYANQYWASPGDSFSWSTHIGSMKFANCSIGPQGTLTGTVKAAASGSGIAGAKVTLTPGNIVVTTGNDGSYSITLAVGNYTATASAFGFGSKNASVTITEDQTTTQDFSLTAAPTATLSGNVTDGSGHGWGLYAEVKVAAAGFGPVADVWTNPQTGAYSVDLPTSTNYTVDFTAYTAGYNPDTESFTLSGNKTLNAALTVSTSCTAPGYQFAHGFGQDFNGSTFPPTGWTVTNAVSGSDVVWKLNTAWSDDNWTGGTGTAADSNSGKASGRVGHDTSLVTPPIPVTSLHGATTLKYKANFQNYAADALDLDISTDGGNTWVNIKHWTTDHGGFDATPGVDVKVDLTSYLPATGNFQLRWRNYDLAGSGWDWYAQVDDVQIGGCAPTPGGIVKGSVTSEKDGSALIGATLTADTGQSTETFANPLDPNLTDGLYILFLDTGSRTLTASFGNYTPQAASFTIANNESKQEGFSLKSATFTTDPGSFDVHVKVNEQGTQTLTIKNVGTDSGHFEIKGLNGPAPTPAVPTGPFAPTPNYASGTDLAALLAPGAHPQLSDTKPRIDPAPNAAGDVVSTFPAGIAIYGLGADHDASDVWVSSPSYGGLGGDDLDHRFLLDGTNTGDTIDVSGLGVLYMADLAYDDNTGMLWEVSVENSGSNIYELDPATMQPTGNKIQVPSPQSERGLAFDPKTNTWFAGDFNSTTIYHFDASGALLDSANVGLPITGLAYNAATGHLFVLTSAGTHAVYVLDANNNYAQLSSFDITGFNSSDAGAGLGYTCGNNLVVSDFTNKVVYIVDSGETGWCAHKGISWLTIAPASGTLAVGATTDVTLTFDGTDQQEFTTSEGHLKVEGGVPSPPDVALKVTWDPQPVDLDVSGAVSPTGTVAAGDNLTYNITVQNLPDAGGSATETQLSYEIPNGVNYLASNGATCAPPAGSAPPPASGGFAIPAMVQGPAALTCDLGTIDPNKGKLVTIAVQAATAADSVSATFTASAREPQQGSGNTSLTLDTNPAVGPPGPTGPTGPQGPKGDSGLGLLGLGVLVLLGAAGVAIETRKRRQQRN